MGFTGVVLVKNTPAIGRPGFNPGQEDPLNPLQYSRLKNSMDRPRELQSMRSQIRTRLSG